ncbi:MAG: ATP-binding protein [Candidatus Geothermarchaeales archaeon]
MVKISEIVSQNPWWKHGKRFYNYDKHLSEANQSLIFFKRKELEASKENMYIVRGCRQVGKSTYLKERIRELIRKDFNPQHILYLSLDFFISRRELRNAINYFLDKNREAESLYIFLDEITGIEDWSHELKYLSDSGVIKRASIICTGSSCIALRRETELLPGRGLEGNEYYIKPLSFREFILQTVEYVAQIAKTSEFYNSLLNLKPILEETSIDLSSDLDRIINQINVVAPYKKELEYLFRIYLITGGFPAIVNDYLRRKSAGEGEYIDPTFAEMFVRNILGDVAKLGKQETLARQILKEVITKYGTRYSFSKLARDVESTHVTTIDYLELLEESFILTILYSYDFNKKYIKFKGSKKIFFQDPFILYSLKSFLTGDRLNEVITQTQQDEELLSEIVEGIVCSHLIMNEEKPILKEPKTFLWFYYDTRGRELDYVLRTEESYLGVEVKYQGSVSFEEVLKVPQIKKYVILTKEDIGKEKNVLMIPVELLLSLLKKSNCNL